MSHHLQSETDQTIPPEGSSPLPFPTTDPVQLSSGAGTGAQDGWNPGASLLWLSSPARCLLPKIYQRLTRSGGALCEQVGGFQHFSCSGVLPDMKWKIPYN